MTQRLPPILQEIAEVISLDAAIKLAEAKGGQRIAIPTKLRDDHWLIDVLGSDDAIALCGYFANGTRVHMDVPFGPTSDAARREAMIAKLIKEGKSANEIAQACRFTRRTAFAKKAKHKELNAKGGTSLPDLFNSLK